jgi:hypothetical protein
VLQFSGPNVKEPVGFNNASVTKISQVFSSGQHGSQSDHHLIFLFPDVFVISTAFPKKKKNPDTGIRTM